MVRRYVENVHSDRDCCSDALLLMSRPVSSSIDVVPKREGFWRLIWVFFGLGAVLLTGNRHSESLLRALRDEPTWSVGSHWGPRLSSRESGSVEPVICSAVFCVGGRNVLPALSLRQKCHVPPVCCQFQPHHTTEEKSSTNWQSHTSFTPCVALNDMCYWVITFGEPEREGRSHQYR